MRFRRKKKYKGICKKHRDAGETIVCNHLAASPDDFVEEPIFQGMDEPSEIPPLWCNDCEKSRSLKEDFGWPDFLTRFVPACTTCAEGIRSGASEVHNINHRKQMKNYKGQTEL